MIYLVEGGQQPKDISCADGWIYYAGACWYAANFGSESKTRKEAADHCQGAGGTLAEFRTEEEHWFSYTLFIPTVTGTLVYVETYIYIYIYI